MSNAIKVIYPDGTEKELNRKLSLEEMQKIVGGLIQIVRAKEAHRSLVVNDEGLLLGLPRNEKAYELLHPDFDWRKVVGYENFCIVGNAILIKS